jgi:hypothetical protein
MMALNKHWYHRSHDMPMNITGVHLAARFGLTQMAMALLKNE